MSDKPDSNVAARLPETMTWSRMPDGMECSQPCAVTIALRIYESGHDMVPPNCPEFNMHEAAIGVLNCYLRRENEQADRVAQPEATGPRKGRFVLVNGAGEFLTVSGAWVYSVMVAAMQRNDRLELRLFLTRAQAETAAGCETCRTITVVELDPK